MRLLKVLQEATRDIEASGHAVMPRREAEELMCHLLQADRSWLYAHSDDELTNEQWKAMRGLVLRRARGEPLAYVTGRVEFCGRHFSVSPGVLIPRPETELIVDLARREGAKRIVDVGTGCGALAVTLALETDALVVATDVSAAALSVAGQNARDLAARVRFLRADGLDAFAPDSVDLIVANPPYVDPSDRAALPVDVREFEPPEALFSARGLAHLESWIAGAARVLRPGGRLLFEIGFGQASRMMELVAGQPALGEARIHPDFRDIPRVLDARREAT